MPLATTTDLVFNLPPGVCATCCQAQVEGSSKKEAEAGKNRGSRPIRSGELQ